MECTIDKVFRSFRKINKPQKVKGCNCSFCISEKEIIKLLNADQKLLTCGELYSYVNNVLITVGSPDDFIFLLPAILKVWSEQLYANKDSAYNQRLHGALIRSDLDKSVEYLDASETTIAVNAKEGFLYCHLPESLRKIVLSFMGNEIFKRIGKENSLSIIGKTSTHSWFRVFASYGVFSNNIEQLWQQWWSTPTKGHAIALVQYASCLICDEKANPVFAPWDPKIGGGTPLLWNYESFFFGEYWMEENLEFLKKVLSVDYLHKKLEDTQYLLKDPLDAKIVTEVRNILDKEFTKVELRIERLIDLLGKPSAPGGPFDWGL